MTTSHYLIPYPEPGLGAAWDFHDRRNNLDARRAEKMRRLSERMQRQGRAVRSTWAPARRRARGAQLTVTPPPGGMSWTIVGPTAGPTWTDSPFVQLPNQIVPGPGGQALGDLWDAHNAQLGGLWGKVKKGLKKVVKVVKKVAPYAAAGAALYFTAGAAAPFVQKLFAGRKQPEIYGPPLPPDMQTPQGPGLLQTIGGALIPALTAGLTSPAPGSQAYYDQLPPGYAPPYSPYASSWDPAAPRGPGESPFPYATYGTGYGYEAPTEAGMLGGIDMKTILLIAGAGAAVLLLTRGGGGRSGRR